MGLWCNRKRASHAGTYVQRAEMVQREGVEKQEMSDTNQIL